MNSRQSLRVMAMVRRFSMCGFGCTVAAVAFICAAGGGAWAQSTAPNDLAETAAPQWNAPDPATLSTEGESPASSTVPASENLSPPKKPAEDKTSDYFRAHQAAWDIPNTPAGSSEAAASNSVSSPTFKYSAARSAMALFAICAVVILLGWLLRRYGKRTPLLAGMNLGSVLGKVYLTPRVSLYYVRTGGKVLVLGVTPTGVSLISAFEPEVFETAVEPLPMPVGTPHSETFLAQLHTQTEKLNIHPASEDDELATLRGDIQRLQQYLQESARDGGE